MVENFKYNYEVLGKKVAIQFKVGKKGTARPYIGTIRRVQISMEEDGVYEVLHEVVFNDGEEHWLDLEEVEGQGRLEWRHQERKQEKEMRVDPVEVKSSHETPLSEKPKQTEQSKSLKKPGQPIRVSLNKAKMARRTMLKSLVAASKELAVVTPAQPPKKKRKREEQQEPTTKKGDLQWVEDMYDWMVNIGSDGRGATPKSALRIRKEVLKLATGEGITHRQWSSKGIKNFFAGTKVDLSFDMDDVYKKSQQYQDRYGKDPSHGWLMQGPIQKLKAYKEYVESQS